MKKLPFNEKYIDIGQHIYSGGKFDQTPGRVLYTIQGHKNFDNPYKLPNNITKKGLDIISEMKIPPGILRIHHDTFSPQMPPDQMIKYLSDLKKFGDCLHEKKIFGHNAVIMDLFDRKQANYIVLTQKPQIWDDDLYEWIATAMNKEDEIYLIFSPGKTKEPNMALAQIYKKDPVTVKFHPFALIE